MADTIYIYSDGACSGNPGPGGWGVLLRLILGWMDAWLTPDLSASGPARTIYPATFWLAGVVLLVGAFILFGIFILPGLTAGG